MLLNETTTGASHTILFPFARWRTAVRCLLATAALSGTCQARDSYSRALDRFLHMHPAEFLAQLERHRPPVLAADLRARVIAALPEQGEIKNLSAVNRQKLESLTPVLRVHRRETVYSLKVIESWQTKTGLHARFVLLITEPALRALSPSQLQAVVAHEIGHEYVWDEYEGAASRGDWGRLRELELYCDGLAIVTLVKIGADPRALTAALQRMDTLNRRREQTNDKGSDGDLSLLSTQFYPTLAERRLFAERLIKWLKGFEGVSRFQ